MAVYNHLLFSELFFRQIRRNTDDLDNLRATLGTIRDTWQYYLPSPENTATHAWQPAAPIDKNDVHQLRSNFIEPVFGYLELVYAPCDADDRAFFLYGDWEQKNRTGLCLVLPYSAHIEGRDPVTTRIPKGRNYAQQLQKLLHAHDLEWGVLTNGRFWRLYHRSELSPTDTYLQVDLGNVISTENIHDYIVFHRFFSRPAFVQENGRQRLDIYKEQSDKATQQIEDHLSTHVEEVVRYLSQGLVESCQANQEDITSRDTRTAIYQNALFLVYRLLFALYAEARDLLPLDNPTYAAVCLRSLLQQVNHNHTNGLSYEDDYAMWDHLQALFALIDQGDADAEVPAYNGGLFDPGRRPFLTKHRIRNTFLQAALLRLAYLPAKGKTYDQDRRPLLIDYRDLSVRHLGSLYEGLLEYNLFVVRDEPRVVRATKKTTRYVPYSKAGKVRSTETVLQIGEVYFSETEGERKATGSYYTPEDVVAYIVRNTVGEVLQDRQQRFLEDQAIQQQLKDLADTPADIPAYAQIQRALDEQFLRFVNRQILDLKVLDPAMGSGHFLVNVTHNIANFIVDFLNETDWENPGIDTDVAYWKRLVAERCIFGVDLNELAVELAKLCLWMTTTAKGKPLTFVDHHIRRGNSLVGAWLKDVGVYPFVKKESIQAFTLPLSYFQINLDEVLAAYQDLYAKNQDNVEEVREKARLYDEKILPILQPFRELLNLHTNLYFGSGLDEATYAKLGRAIKNENTWSELRKDFQQFLSSKKPWLFWELEFPEVFSEANSGFDVVLGNPPYADQDEQSHAFIEKHFSSHNSGDLYTLFIELMESVSSEKAFSGMILPLSLTFSRSMTTLREHLQMRPRHWLVSSFDRIPDALFGSNVRTRNSIMLMQPSEDQEFHLSTGPLRRWFAEERQALFDSITYYNVDSIPLDLGWPKIGSQKQVEILAALMSTDAKLDDITVRTSNIKGHCVYYAKTAYNWLTASRNPPPVYDKKGKRLEHTGFGELLFEREEEAWFAVSILTSSFAFWFWLVFGDGFHVTSKIMKSIPVAPQTFNQKSFNALVTLGQQIQSAMEKHIVFKWNAGKKVGNYNLRYCRELTNKVDEIIFEESGLSVAHLENMWSFLQRNHQDRFGLTYEKGKSLMLIKLTAGYRLDFGQIARIASFLNMPENEKLAGKQIADQLGISRARLGRLWMMARALGLGTKGIWKLTDLGKVIIEHDPYLDDIGTLWLLHFVISSDPDILVWNKMINHVFPENHHVNMSIAKPYFEDALADFSVASYEQHLNKEIQSFFDAYTGQHFENLGYMLEEDDKNYRLTPSQSIPPHILGASILIYRERFAPNVATLDINTLAQTDNSPGRIFALTQRQLRDLLENIKNKGYIFVESRADLDQIRFRDDIYPIDTIQRYYEER